MNRGVFTKWQQGQPEEGLAESIRLAEDSFRERNWKRRPYLPERQWATVREDYSPSFSVHSAPVARSQLLERCNLPWQAQHEHP